MKPSIANFKGITTMVVALDNQTNSANKISIAEAGYWLLLSKNISDKKDFNVKSISLNQ